MILGDNGKRCGWSCLAAVFLAGLVILSGLRWRPVLAQPSATVLTGAYLIDGTGRPPLAQASLLVSDGRIRAVGHGVDLTTLNGVTQIDVSGKTIMPGLITAHAHLNDGNEALLLRAQLLAQLRIYAEYGVTTVHTLGDGRSAAFQAHAPTRAYPWEVVAEGIWIRGEQERAEQFDRARLYVSGPNVTAKTVAEARDGVDRVADLNVNIIKTRLDDRVDDMSPEVYRALIRHAHRRGLRVVAHAVTLEDAKHLADAGVDVIAHSVRDRDVDSELIAKFTRQDVGYIPTLTRNLSLFLYESVPSFFGDPFFVRASASYKTDMELIQNRAFQETVRSSKQAQAGKRTLVQAKRNLKLLVDGGVRIAMGTDSGTQVGRWQGYFEHVELELMVEAGLAPMQALVAATGDAAKVMHLEELGTLEPGKWADFVVLNANPLDDIKNTQRIHSVWVGGQRLGNRNVR